MPETDAPPRVTPRLTVDDLLDAPDAPEGPGIDAEDVPPLDVVERRLRAAYALLAVFVVALPLAGFGLALGLPVALGFAGLAASSLIASLLLGAV